MLNFCNTLMKMLFITTITHVFGSNGYNKSLCDKVYIYTNIRIRVHTFKFKAESPSILFVIK